MSNFEVHPIGTSERLRRLEDLTVGDLIQLHVSQDWPDVVPAETVPMSKDWTRLRRIEGYLMHQFQT